MELFSCLLLLLTASSEHDTLWVMDLSGIPSGWEADLHWSNTGSMQLFLNSQVQNVFDFDHSSLNTDYCRSLPDTDSLILIVKYVWTGWGAYSGGMARDGAFSRSRINVHYGNAFYTLWDTVAGHLWFDEPPTSDAVTRAESGPYSTSSQGTLTLKLPDIPDWQWFRIEFRGDTGGFQDPSRKGGQYAYIKWDLESATLLSYRSGTSD